MLKYFCLNFLILLCGASVIHVPLIQQNIVPFENSLPTRDLEQIQEKWWPHIMDFLMLIDTSKVMSVAVGYISDPDVLNFVAFISSTEFKDIVLEIENIEEFKEAVDFLQSKGYEIKSIIDLVNSLLDLQYSKAQQKSDRSGRGLTDLIHGIINVLPIEDMKKLFEKKLETSPEIAELFETLSSEEFKDIMKRLAENPKLLEIKNFFEGFGLDFNNLCSMFDDIFGDFFDKIFGNTI